MSVPSAELAIAASATIMSPFALPTASATHARGLFSVTRNATIECFDTDTRSRACTVHETLTSGCNAA